MLLKKGMLSFAALALPLVSTMASAGHYNGIDALRNRCIEFRQNAQINHFGIKVLCSGSYTFWETEDNGYSLATSSAIHTATSCKGNRFQTRPGDFLFETAPFGGGCFSYVKKEMRAPEGVGIALNIQDCEELTAENVEALCRNEIHSYCGDQFVPAAPMMAEGSLSSTSSIKADFGAPVDQQQQQQPYGQEGVCTLSVVDRIDTCSMF